MIHSEETPHGFTFDDLKNYYGENEIENLFSLLEN